MGLNTILKAKIDKEFPGKDWVCNDPFEPCGFGHTCDDHKLEFILDAEQYDKENPYEHGKDLPNT